MDGHIIPLRGDPHARIQALLPWFVTGRLEPNDLTEVETHLTQCAACRREAEVERRLRDEVVAMPSELADGWAKVGALLDKRRRPSGWSRRWGRFVELARGSRPAARGWMGWAMAAQAVALVALASLALGPAAPPAAYRALGSEPVSRTGNVILIFKPQAREAAIRAAIRAGQGRLVDGPTAADGYVLSVPAGQRTKVLSALRRDPNVVLAEPIDSDAPS
jgi:anti-sigma factor RsiW